MVILLRCRKAVDVSAVMRDIFANSDDFGQSFRAEVGHLFRLMLAGHSD
jgi:hypothetical protein